MHSAHNLSATSTHYALYMHVILFTVGGKLSTRTSVKICRAHGHIAGHRLISCKRTGKEAGSTAGAQLQKSQNSMPKPQPATFAEHATPQHQHHANQLYVHNQSFNVSQDTVGEERRSAGTAHEHCTTMHNSGRALCTIRMEPPRNTRAAAVHPPTCMCLT